MAYYIASLDVVCEISGGAFALSVFVIGTIIQTTSNGIVVIVDCIEYGVQRVCYVVCSMLL